MNNKTSGRVELNNESNVTEKILDLCQQISDKYLKKAASARSRNKKKQYYNEVLFYSGCKSLIQQHQISPQNSLAYVQLMNEEDESKKSYSNN